MAKSDEELLDSFLRQYDEQDDIYDGLLWLAGLLGDESQACDEAGFIDDAHPLACYVAYDGDADDERHLDAQRMEKISDCVDGALRLIQEDKGISTKQELTLFLGVGKNQPREWVRHPECIKAKDVDRICELSGLELKWLRGFHESSFVRGRRDGLPRFRSNAELIHFYNLLSDEQQSILTRMIYEMNLANRMRAVYAGDWKP